MSARPIPELADPDRVGPDEPTGFIYASARRGRTFSTTAPAWFSDEIVELVDERNRFEAERDLARAEVERERLLHSFHRDAGAGLVALGAVLLEPSPFVFAVVLLLSGSIGFSALAVRAYRRWRGR